MTVVMLAAPLGVVLGFSLTYFMKTNFDWEYSFIMQALALIPCAICLWLVPNHYLNIHECIEFRKNLD